MCDPSTSASVIIIILWYLNLFRSNSWPIPVPNAVIIVLISSFPNALSNLAFSTFNILPLSGSIAWVIELRPLIALPPALSPSTKNISQTVGSFSLQSTSFPPKLTTSKSLFLLVSSLALFAATLALAAVIHLSIISFASSGFSSKYLSKPSEKTSSAIFLTSAFPSFVFVCPSNCGSGCLQEIIIVKPSLTSSPDSGSSLSFRYLFFLA